MIESYTIDRTDKTAGAELAELKRAGFAVEFASSRLIHMVRRVK